ncbi:hypothetical protein V5799_024295, partial [Amblyomma americanum]
MPLTGPMQSFISTEPIATEESRLARRLEDGDDTDATKPEKADLNLIFSSYKACSKILFAVTTTVVRKGMSAILTLFLINVLMFEEHTAKSVYHGFVMACYFSPVLGAMIADSYLGKF